MITMSLSLQQTKFVLEYCVDFHGTKAAIRAGYAEKGAHVQASVLLKNPKIQEAIEENKRQLAVAASITPQRILQQLAAIAFADNTKLMQLRRTCCRHCHGYNHQYQWSEAEYINAVNVACEIKKPPPDGAGGFGWNANLPPVPGCPECSGLGLEQVHIEDTRKLSKNEKSLYAGVQKTKDGIKVLIRDQEAALDKLMRYTGMLVDKKEISGPGGAPLAIMSAKELTDEQLAAIAAMTDDDDKQE